MSTVEEILSKLNLTQLKQLIVLYGLEKPHSKSNKMDYIQYLLSSDANLDAKMLVNYFSLTIKSGTKPTKKETDTQEIYDISNLITETPIRTTRRSKKKRSGSKRSY